MQGATHNIDSLVNYPEIAKLYSQLSGVLAGFVFTSLIGLICAQISTRRHLDLTLRSYRPLIAAFLGLVATSLNYAIIAGEKDGTERVTQLAVAAGLGFCIAGTMALYSILVLLRGIEGDLYSDRPGSGRSAELLRRTIVFGACPLLFVLMWGAQRDHLAMKYASSGFHGLDLAYMIAGLLTLLLSFIKRNAHDDGGENSGKLIEFICYVAVAITIASLLTSSLTISYTDRNSLRSDYFYLPYLLVLTFFFWLIIWSSASYRPRQVSTKIVRREESNTNTTPPSGRLAAVIFVLATVVLTTVRSQRRSTRRGI